MRTIRRLVRGVMLPLLAGFLVIEATTSAGAAAAPIAARPIMGTAVRNGLLNVDSRVHRHGAALLPHGHSRNRDELARDRAAARCVQLRTDGRDRRLRDAASPAGSRASTGVVGSESRVAEAGELHSSRAHQHPSGSHSDCDQPICRSCLDLERGGRSCRHLCTQPVEQWDRARVPRHRLPRGACRRPDRQAVLQRHRGRGSFRKADSRGEHRQGLQSAGCAD